MGEYSTSPANRRKFMTDTIQSYMKLMQWKPISAEEIDDDEFEKRFDEFVSVCVEEDEDKNKVAMRPTIEGFCVACGISRQTFESWKIGTIPVSQRRRMFISRIDGFFLSLLTEWAMNGNVNPTMSTFYLKNNYGYSDKVTHELKPEQTLLEKAKTNEEILAIVQGDTGITEIITKEKEKDNAKN